ncbi:hypothetical protein [Inconstantimicrobium mannanitabidum]|uniref:Uncharacterized protein n=1 Tax=Inconstantimicrobium mannanitabidum TaxID=1604901 RepID=A0ACB5R9V2_9CLOT|nr:hypothetical protein [Clostridium sp. TW13]GKX65810.1 hypothetical protein rsdtw13_10680 [Clostridium sp. TW13]
MNGGETLRYIRTTLGLKQKDIRSEGLMDVTGIERGAIQMSSKIAIALEKKLNEVIKEKHLEGILDFEVTSLIFKKGLDVDLEECFKQMSKDYKIDKFLELTQEKYEFSNVKRAIEILKKDYSNNLNSISILSYLIIENSKDDSCLVYAYLQLQRVAYYKIDWNGIITYYDVIKDKIDCCSDTEMKDYIYMNTATAYCMVGQNVIAKELVSKIKYTISNRDYIDNLLTNINVNLEKYDEAIINSCRILEHATNVSQELTSKFNICCIASFKNDMDLFHKYFNLIEVDKEYYQFTREQFFQFIIKACETLKINDENTLTKIFKISKKVCYKNIENIDYFYNNLKLISEIIIKNNISIDAEMFIYIYKNINLETQNREKLVTLCEI